MPNDRTLPERLRKEIFLALVVSKDLKLPVAESRRLVTEYFGIAERELRKIEAEGIEHEWPPL